MRRMLLLVGAFVVGAAALLASCGGGGTSGGTNEEAEPPLPAGEIVFTRMLKPGRSDLYVMRPDGSQVRLLVRNAADAAVSPDGRRIAFVRRCGIWLMRRDGGGQRPLTRERCDGGDSDPAWSPDGATLYFSRMDHKQVHDWSVSLFSIRANGTSLAALATAKPSEDGRCFLTPAPSPDGRLVAYTDETACITGRMGANDRIVAVTIVGRPAKLPFRLEPPLDPNGWWQNYADPAWARDGRRIAYIASGGPDDGIAGLYVTASNGIRPQRVIAAANGYFPDRSPAWSRDGNWIAFTRNAGSEAAPNHDIWIIRPDGSAARATTRTSADDRSPAWLPPAD